MSKQVLLRNTKITSLWIALALLPACTVTPPSQSLEQLASEVIWRQAVTTPVKSVAVNASGDRIATGSPVTTSVLDASTGEEVWSATDYYFNGLSVTFNPEGTLVATTSDGNSNSIVLLDANSGTFVRGILAPTTPSSLVFSPDGQQLVAGGFQYVKVYSTSTYAEVFTLGEWRSVEAVSYSPTGSKIIVTGETSSFDNIVATYNANTGVLESETFLDGGYFVSSATTSPTGSLIAVTGARSVYLGGGQGGSLGFAKLIDATTGEETLSLEYDLYTSFSSVAFTNDQLFLVTAGSNPQGGVVTVWDIQAGEVVETVTETSAPGGPQNQIYDLFVRSDGTVVATSDTSVTLYKLDNSGVAGSPPTPPQLLSPADGGIVANNFGLSVVANDPENSNLRYQIEFSLDNFATVERAFDQRTNPELWSKRMYSSGEAVVFNPPEFPNIPVGTIYWRARASDGKSFGGYSAVQSFNYSPSIQWATLEPQGVQVDYPTFQMRVTIPDGSQRDFLYRVEISGDASFTNDTITFDQWNEPWGWLDWKPIPAGRLMTFVPPYRFQKQKTFYWRVHLIDPTSFDLLATSPRKSFALENTQTVSTFPVSRLGRVDSHQIKVFNPENEPMAISLAYKVAPDTAGYTGSYRIEMPNGDLIAAANYGEPILTMTPPLPSGETTLILKTSTQSLPTSPGELRPQVAPVLAVVGLAVGGSILANVASKATGRACESISSGDGFAEFVRDTVGLNTASDVDWTDLLGNVTDAVVGVVENAEYIQMQQFNTVLNETLITKYGMPLVSRASAIAGVYQFYNACQTGINNALAAIPDIPLLPSRPLPPPSGPSEPPAEILTLPFLEMPNPFDPISVPVEDTGPIGSGGGAAESKALPIVTSYDPNIKLVAAGVNQYIRPTTPLPYTIFFENLPGASFAAQEVFISDILDEDVDLTTFSFTGVTLFGQFYPLASGTDFYLTIPVEIEGEVNNPVNPPRSVEVQVSGYLDMATREVFISFYGFDPETGELHPFGFLNPNKTSPEGEGGISYRAKPLETSVPGTTLENQASIVFDTNAPIITNQISLTVDDSAPVTSVTSLPTVIQASTFDIPLQATDTGSGIKQVEVWYTINEREDTINGSTFYSAGASSNLTNLQVTLEDALSGIYRFYTVGEDKAGNKELVPTEPSATVEVQVAQQPLLVVRSGTALTDRAAFLGEQKAPIIQVILEAPGNEPLNVTMLSLAATGDGNDLTDVLRVRVFEDTNNNGRVDIGESELVNGLYSVNNGTLNLPVTYVVPGGLSKSLLVTYDFRP